MKAPNEGLLATGGPLMLQIYLSGIGAADS